MTIGEAIRNAASRLSAGGIEEPFREASSLAGYALDRDRAYLIAHDRDGLTAEEKDRLDALIERRAAREPLQYIYGSQEFCGLEIEVGPGVLIPRPETEMLARKATELLRESSGHRFLDIGTGSGCIAVAILHSDAEALGVAADIDALALTMAEKNARRHAVHGRLRLVASDLFEAIGPERFDLIVSNPPYIPVEAISELQPEVRDHEPRLALTDGGDGLSIIRKLVNEAPRSLRPGGWLLIEIGLGQAQAVAEMFDGEIWAGSKVEPDVRGIGRMAIGQLR